MTVKLNGYMVFEGTIWIAYLTLKPQKDLPVYNILYKVTEINLLNLSGWDFLLFEHESDLFHSENILTVRSLGQGEYMINSHSQ